MDFKISSIKIECEKETVLLPFSDGITFFYGNTGVGKTTLLNLINYTLGQDIIRTQIIDDEVKCVCMDALICGHRLTIERRVFSNLITVRDENKLNSFLAKSSNGAGDIFSDYLYHLAGIKPINMLRGRSSKTVRISFANFMWYNYLRQDELDNTLFYLDEKNGNFKQYASNYVLHTILSKSREIEKKFAQEVNRITEKQEAIQIKLSVMREMYTVSKLFGIDIGKEISKKYQILGDIKREIENLAQEDTSLGEAQKRHLIDQARLAGKYEAEIRYLQEFGKIQGLRKSYESMYEEYEIEKQKYIEQLRISNDGAFANNIVRLQELFKDCLLGVGFPNFSKSDTIVIHMDSLVPSVHSITGEFRFNYHTLSSSGIRTIFKICYALSIHRFIRDQQIETLLPTLLMIDTPMKNISERIDNHLHAKLYRYFYELFSKGGALNGVQLIIIDKEIPDIFKRNNIACKMFTKESPLIPL